jgi:hypothetical protein
MKQGDLRDKFTKAAKSVCTSTILVSVDPLVSYSINCFSYEDSRKHSRGLAFSIRRYPKRIFL